LTSDYEIFVVEDLGMLPKEPLGQIFHRIGKKAPVVNVIHDGRLSEDPAFYQFEWDAIVCFDERYKNFLKEVYDVDKIHIISYPCHSLQKGNKEDARKLLNLPLNKKIIFGFGPASEKILDDIDALYDISEEYPVMLLILNKKKEVLKKFNGLVGTGKLEIKTREEAPDIDKLYKYLHAADLLLFNKEGPQWVVISSTVYQTLGSTCPIVARNAGFISDLNKEVLKYTNQNELKDRICSVFNQDKKYKETTKAALEFVNNNSAEKVAERYVELFQRLRK
jgi:glycosyltransferase involved in cell wall biosynthesis